MHSGQITDLVIKIQNGQTDEFNSLFNLCYDDIYYFSLKTVKDENLACDITQETFIEIFNTLNNLKEPEAFISWARKITYHQCTRYFKKRQDVTVEENEDGTSIFDTIEEDNSEFIPDEALDNAEFKTAILDIINTLSEEQRSAVMMYYFDELSVKQIAEIQNTTEGTVKSRLNYARKKIKEEVEAYEKKNGVKLHAFPFFPFFRWFFGDTKVSMPQKLAANCAKNVSASTSVPVTVNSAAAVGSAVKTAGIIGKAAQMSLTAKIISITVAVAIVGTVTGAVVINKSKENNKGIPVPVAVTEVEEADDNSSQSNQSSEYKEYEADYVVSAPTFDKPGVLDTKTFLVPQNNEVFDRHMINDKKDFLLCTVTSENLIELFYYHKDEKMFYDKKELIIDRDVIGNDKISDIQYKKVISYKEFSQDINTDYEPYFKEGNSLLEISFETNNRIGIYCNLKNKGSKIFVNDIRLSTPKEYRHIPVETNILENISPCYCKNPDDNKIYYLYGNGEKQTEYSIELPKGSSAEMVGETYFDNDNFYDKEILKIWFSDPDFDINTLCYVKISDIPGNLKAILIKD